MRPYPLEETWNPGRRDFNKTATGRATAAATAHRGQCQSTKVRLRAPKAAEVTALWPFSTCHSAFRLGLAVQRLVWFDFIRQCCCRSWGFSRSTRSTRSTERRGVCLGYYPPLLLSAARCALCAAADSSDPTLARLGLRLLLQSSLSEPICFLH